MKKLILGISVAVMLSMSAKGQDIHFTQYFTSPLTLNPAMTGLVTEDLRLAGNYRTQWSSVSPNPYTTATFSFDIAMLKNKLPDGDALGLGIMALNDKAGSGGLTNTTIGGSLAYHKAFGFNKQHRISLGVQGNMVSKKLDFSKLTFEDGYNYGTNTFTPGIGTDPSMTSNSISYMDFNGGLMYSGRVYDHVTAYFGYSYYHLTQPVETFLKDNTHPIHSRQSLYMGGAFDLNERTVLYSSLLYQSQASATEILMGSAVGFILNPGHDQEFQKNTVLYLGGWYRFGDALAPYIALEWAKMRIGLSYDINLSSFTPATSGGGGYELSLLFFGRINKHERNPEYTWTCPKIF